MTQILQGDCLDVLPTLEPASVQTCVTSPPYWGLRDYGCDSQIGLEATPGEYVANMVRVFREVWRVLRDDGTLWVNMGDSYGTGANGQNFYDPNSDRPGGGRLLKEGGFGHVKRTGVKGMHKQLMGIPWRLAFALQADGWYLRSDIIWHKPNPMPESVTDRPTKAHEYIFLLTKQERYFYDAEAIKESASGRSCGNRTYKYEGVKGHETKQGILAVADIEWQLRNKRTVWTVATQPYSEAHFATFPEDLIKSCILSGSRVGDTVIDPFAGSGTTGLVATELGRRSVLIELNPKYVQMIRDRTNVTLGML